MGLNDLKKMAKKNKTNGKKAAAKKEKVNVDVEPVAEHEEAWVEANAQLQEAKAKKEQAERSILEHIEPEWIKECRRIGEAQNSCNLGRVRLTFKGKSQFLTSSSLDEDRLKDSFSDEEFDLYFAEKEGPMRLTSEAVANPQIVEVLTEAIGKIQEQFPDTQIIDFDTKIVPKDALFNDWVLRADLHQKLEEKIRAAGAQKTKVSFSSR